MDGVATTATARQLARSASEEPYDTAHVTLMPPGTGRGDSWTSARGERGHERSGTQTIRSTRQMT